MFVFGYAVYDCKDCLNINVGLTINIKAAGVARGQNIFPHQPQMVPGTYQAPGLGLGRLLIYLLLHTDLGKPLPNNHNVNAYNDVTLAVNYVTYGRNPCYYIITLLFCHHCLVC